MGWGFGIIRADVRSTEEVKRIMDTAWELQPGNRKRFEEIIQSAGFFDREHERSNFDGMVDGWQTRVSPDLTLPREGIERIVMEERRAGRIPGSFDVDDALCLEPLIQAQRELSIGQ